MGGVQYAAASRQEFGRSGILGPRLLGDDVTIWGRHRGHNCLREPPPYGNEPGIGAPSPPIPARSVRCR